MTGKRKNSTGSKKYPQYSEGFDCLLNVARGNCYSPGSSEWKFFLKDFQRLSDKREGIADDLLDGLERFREAANQAIVFLSGPATLGLGNEAEGDLVAALDLLDAMVHLELLLEEHGRVVLTGMDEAFALELRSVILEDLEKWLPIHRLIPLNDWRRQRLAAIPEHARHRFPWYEDYLSFTPSTLGEIHTHWREIIVEKDLSWLEIPEEMSGALLAAIKKDRPLYRSLYDLAGYKKPITKAVDSSIPLRLMLYGNLLERATLTPVAVATKGLRAVACRMLIRPLQSEQERQERLLLAGLFAPDKDLTAHERLAIFKMVGQWLDSGPKTSAGSLARRLMNRGGDPQSWGALLDLGRGYWRFLMERTAATMAGPEPDVPGAFQAAVAQLRELPVDTLTSRVRSWIERLQAVLPTARIELDLVTIRENLLATLFPDGLALGQAASNQALCLYLRVGDGEPQAPESLMVEVSGPDFQDGLFIYQGRIDFDPRWPYPTWQTCGLMTREGEVVCAQEFSLDHSGYTFQAAFLLEQQLAGQLRIILIHDGK